MSNMVNSGAVPPHGWASPKAILFWVESVHTDFINSMQDGGYAVKRRSFFNTHLMMVQKTPSKERGYRGIGQNIVLKNRVFVSHCCFLKSGDEHVCKIGLFQSRHIIGIAMISLFTKIDIQTSCSAPLFDVPDLVTEITPQRHRSYATASMVTCSSKFSAKHISYIYLILLLLETGTARSVGCETSPRPPATLHERPMQTVAPVSRDGFLETGRMRGRSCYHRAPTTSNIKTPLWMCVRQHCCRKNKNSNCTTVMPWTSPTPWTILKSPRAKEYACLYPSDPIFQIWLSTGHDQDKTTLSTPHRSIGWILYWVCSDAVRCFN